MIEIVKKEERKIMKKIMITTASVLLLTSVGVGFAVNANADKTEVVESHVEASQQETQLDIQEIETDHQENQTETDNTPDFTEYETLTEVVEMDSFHTEVVEDNKRKRVLLLTDDNNKPQYKSIYIKNKNRLKVIDFGGGMVFDQVLSATKEDVVVDEPKVEKKETNDEVAVDEAQVSQSSGLEGYAEYATIANKVDLTKYNVEVVEDNNYKRIILLTDDNNRPQYKSIYVKNKNRLKVIDLNGGLVHNGTI